MFHPSDHLDFPNYLGLVFICAKVKVLTMFLLQASFTVLYYENRLHFLHLCPCMCVHWHSFLDFFEICPFYNLTLKHSNLNVKFNNLNYDDLMNWTMHDSLVSSSWQQAHWQITKAGFCNREIWNFGSWICDRFQSWHHAELLINSH